MRNQAEANLSALIESTDDLIGAFDLDFRLITFNQALSKNIAKNRGVNIALGMKVEDFLPPEPAALFNGHFQRALAEGPFQTTLTTLDGRVIEFAFNPIVAGSKKAGVSVFGKDISDRSRAAANLSALIESTSDFIWSVDRNYRLTTFNGELKRSFEASFGITPVEGMLPQDLLPTERAALFPSLYERALAEGPFRTEYTTRDGRIVEMVFNPIIVEGEKSGVSVFGKDITERKRSEAQQRDSEERYRTVFDTSPDAVMISRMSDGVILDVNQSFVDSAGFERSEVIGRKVKELGIWVNDNDLQIFVDTLHRDSRCQNFEVKSRRKNGEIFWMRISSSLIEIDGSQCRISFAQDISETKAAADAMRMSEERYRTVFETSPDAICIIRLSDTLYIDVNQYFLDILGFEREEVIGKTAQELGIWVDDSDRQAMLETARENSGFRALEAQFRKKSGEIAWGEVSSSVIEIDGVACLLTVTRDITSAKAAEKTIRSLAFYDSLTGLPNRRQLFEQLRLIPAASTGSGRLRALLLVDLDHFKTFNDTLGHQTGDLLLKEVARRVAAAVYEGDTVCRLGGDEFAVMLENLSEVAEEAATQARAVGEHVLAAIGRPYSIENREYQLTASIGITIFGGRQKSTDEVLQQADIAMDESKAAGRNTMRFFSPALQAAVNARAALIEDLRQAIQAKQFLLYYQPLVERGRVTGAEALIRWNHPVRGLVMPDDFIPVAEQSRLILPIGDWVLETVCAQIAAWGDRKQTSRLVLSVNVSALQFRQPEFVENVLMALDRANANPRNLRLELTESMLVENLDEIVAKMAELKVHGLRFSLDDFGTGYSSLVYLQRLPLDQLKIDRAFVRDILADTTSRAIAQTILSLGKAMGLPVIAEGVETEEQLSLLAGLGCKSFQGFLFSYPVPLDQFHPLLRGIARKTVPRL